MPIQSTCSGCGQILRVADEHFGKLAKCPSCGTVYRVGETNGPTNAIAPSTPEITPASDPIDPFAKLDRGPQSIGGPPPLSPIDNSIPQSSFADSIKAKSYFAQTPDGKVYGPVDYATLEKWAAEGRLNTQCLAKAAEQTSWTTIGQLFGTETNPYAVNYNPAGGTQTAMPQPTTADRSAIILTLGILSWFICCVGQICAIVAVVLGYQDLRPEKTALMSPNAKTMTQVGFYLALVNLALSVIGFIFYFVAAFATVVFDGGNF